MIENLPATIKKPRGRPRKLAGQPPKQPDMENLPDAEETVTRQGTLAIAWRNMLPAIMEIKALEASKNKQPPPPRPLDFLFHNNKVRSVVDEGVLWVCAKDVCDVLGHSNSRKAVADYCRPKGVTNRYTLTAGGEQELQFINQSNLFRFLAKCNLPAAEEFENLVFDEILPSVNEKGHYFTPETLKARQYELLEPILYPLLDAVQSIMISDKVQHPANTMCVLAETIKRLDEENRELREKLSHPPQPPENLDDYLRIHACYEHIFVELKELIKMIKDVQAAFRHSGMSADWGLEFAHQRLIEKAEFYKNMMSGEQARITRIRKEREPYLELLAQAREKWQARELKKLLGPLPEEDEAHEEPSQNQE